MGGLFGNYNQQKQQSQSTQSSNSQNFGSSGFWGTDKNDASRVAFQGLSGLSNTANSQLGEPIPRFQFSQTTPGLFKEQEGWANAFANQLFNKTSGSAAARGQLSPFNTPAIVGSALTKAAPTILPLIGQNLQNAMVIPETIRTQRFQNAMSPLQALIAGLGSYSSGSSSSFGQSTGSGSGFGVGGGLSIGSGGSGGGGYG